MDLGVYLAFYAVFLKLLLTGLAALVLVSGFDDLLTDLVYWSRALYRRLFIYRIHKPLAVERLHEKPQQPMAVMVPAWDESAVIARMLENTLDTLDYQRFTIFVGVYPNDPDTIREVERVRAHSNNIEYIVCPNPGPTSKADCLNWILQGIRNFEEELGSRFAAVLMHDAEDVVHPLELKMFNYLVPKFDFIQLPVYPLEPRWWQMTGGHYLDEFAENHGKDLVVRESLLGQVPCAGVAAAFERNGLDDVAAKRENLVFDTGSLTEDYEFTFRLYRMGLKRQIFVRFGIAEPSTLRIPLLGLRIPRQRTTYIATREMFPRHFTEAVRQKARWIVGIVFQGWQNLGWRGPLRVRYILARDRKGLVSPIVVLLGYFLVLNLLVYWLVTALFPSLGRLPPLVESDGVLAMMLLINAGFLLNRLIQRTIFVHQIYGLSHATLSIPRQIWANVINFFAVLRAIHLFVRSRHQGGSKIAWDKTSHAFPSTDQLQPFRHRLGDLLVQRGIMVPEEVEEALAFSSQAGTHLGEAIIDLGFASEQDVYAVLATQHGGSPHPVFPDQVPARALSRVPKAVAAAYSAVPVGFDENGTLILASDRFHDEESRRGLQSAIGEPVTLELALPSDVAYARHQLYDFGRGESATSKLAERLLARSLVDAEELAAAREELRRRYRPLGQVLVAQGLIRVADLDASLDELRDSPKEALGEHLVATDRLSRADLEKGLAAQIASARSLGQILLSRGTLTAEELSSALEDVATPSSMEEVECE